MIETPRTTLKRAALEPVRLMAAIMKDVETTPESRLTRTGVPSLGRKRPKKPPKNEPSAAAMACMRSDMIIHAAPWPMLASVNMTTAIVIMTGAAGP